MPEFPQQELNALPLSYRRLVGARAFNQVQIDLKVTFTSQNGQDFSSRVAIVKRFNCSNWRIQHLSLVICHINLCSSLMANLISNTDDGLPEPPAFLRDVVYPPDDRDPRYDSDDAVPYHPPSPGRQRQVRVHIECKAFTWLPRVRKFFMVRKKSGNFILSQGKLTF